MGNSDSSDIITAVCNMADHLWIVWLYHTQQSCILLKTNKQTINIFVIGLEIRAVN